MNYFSIVEELKTVLREVGFVTVTYGDFDEVDLKRQNLFPLAHVIIESAGVGQQPFTYAFSIIALDQIADTKEDIGDQPDSFQGIDNTQDVHADLHHRLAKAVELFRRGQSYRDGYQLDGPVDLIPFKDRFETLCAGWLAPLTITSKNYTDVC